MRRTRLTGMLAVTLTLAISVPAHSAAAASDSRTPARTTVTPLSADQITLSNGTVSTAKLYRDSKGRTRVESGSQVTINDPVARTTIRLDSSNGTFQRSVDKPSPRKATVEQEKGLPGPMRSLGTAEINGVRVEGREHTVNLPPLAGLPARTKQVTLWLSTELRLAVRTRITDASGYLYEQSYANVRAGAELPADLFSVPAGYKEAAPAAPAAPAAGAPASTPTAR